MHTPRPQASLASRCSAISINSLLRNSLRVRPPNKNVIRRTFLTFSYVEGPREPPLNRDTLPYYFERRLLAEHASRPAIICRQERPRVHGGPSPGVFGLQSTRNDCLAWNYEEFHRHIQALSRGLSKLGIGKGDRVAVVMGNNSAYGCLQWACASIGAILVTVNPAYRINELLSTLKVVGVKALFIVPRLRSSTYLTYLSETVPALMSSRPGSINIPELPELRHIVVVPNSSEEAGGALESLPSTVDFRDILVWDEDPLENKPHLKPDDVINLQFTSGTTGSPKAVSLTHHNLLNNALFIARCMRLTEKDVLCNVPPLFHCFGNLAAWSQGSCIVYTSELFDPVAIVDALHDEQCTALHGVPTHFLGVLSEVDARRKAGADLDLRRLRTGIAAGSSVPIELMRKLISEMNLVDLTNAYGMTETSPVSFQTTPNDSIPMRTETVGKVHPHVKAKIIDEAGNVVPIGTPGEICVSGYLVQKGYWEDEKQSQSVMKYHDDDPSTLWMHTGDVGIMNEDGYLRVVSRIKDVIIRGGENLFPVQIENRLTFHPDMREAAVIAVPDDKYGEVVGTFIVRTPGTNQTRQEVRTWVAEGMNPQNAPLWIWFIGEDGVPDALPKTASGKVQKHILREWAKDLAASGKGQVPAR